MWKDIIGNGEGVGSQDYHTHTHTHTHTQLHINTHVSTHTGHVRVWETWLGRAASVVFTVESGRHLKLKILFFGTLNCDIQMGLIDRGSQ